MAVRKLRSFPSYLLRMRTADARSAYRWPSGEGEYLRPADGPCVMARSVPRPMRVRPLVRELLRARASHRARLNFLHPLPMPARRWETISMDFVGPLPKTCKGHNVLLSVVNKLNERALRGRKESSLSCLISRLPHSFVESVVLADKRDRIEATLA